MKQKSYVNFDFRGSSHKDIKEKFRVDLKAIDFDIFRVNAHNQYETATVFTQDVLHCHVALNIHTTNLHLQLHSILNHCT